MNISALDPIRILSVYLAPDGEANAWHQGTWSVFVRTAWCNVGCSWCDTKYSWSSKIGTNYTVADLVVEIEKIAHDCQKITLTGGEPLLQPRASLSELFRELRNRMYRITIETAGTEPVSWLKDFDPGLALVLDYKLPSAHAQLPPIVDNYRNLQLPHVVKFVVQDEVDYREALKVIHRMRYEWGCKARLVLSPMNKVGKSMPGFTYAEWVEKMKNSDLPRLGVGLSLQMHRFIYPERSRDEESGGVDYSDIRKLRRQEG